MSKLAQAVEAEVNKQKKGRGKKTAKKGKAAKGKAKSEAIAKVLPAEQPITKEFVAEADVADMEIREGISSIQRDITSLGRLYNNFKDKGYWRAHFKSFEAWVNDVAVERGVKHSQIRLAMRIDKRLVGVGEGKLPAKEVAKMTAQNANLLAGIPPEKRTAKIITAAQELTEKKFQTEIIAPVMKRLGLKTPKGKGVDVDSPIELHKIPAYSVTKETQEEWETTLEVAKWAAKDDDRSVPLLDKAISAICATFLAEWQAKYDEAMSNQAAMEQTA